MKLLAIMFVFTTSCFGIPSYGDPLNARLVMGNIETDISSRQPVFVPNLMVFADGSFLDISTTFIAQTTKSGDGLTYSYKYSVECGILPDEELQLLFHQIERMSHNIEHIEKSLSEAESKLTFYKREEFLFVSPPGSCSEGTLLKGRGLSTLSKSISELKFLRALYSTLNKYKGKGTCSPGFLSRRIARILVRITEMQTLVPIEDKKLVKISTLPFLPLGTDDWHSFDSEEQKMKLIPFIISGEEALVKRGNQIFGLRMAFLPSNFREQSP